MFKSIGLGIACLTLSIAGVTRATSINVDCGKYGDDKCLKTDIGCKPSILDILDTKCVDPKFDCGTTVTESDGHPLLTFLDKLLDKIPDGGNGGCDIKPVVDCKDNHDSKTCDVIWKDKKDHDDQFPCDLNFDCSKGQKDHCDLVIDCGNHDGCDTNCTPAPCEPPAAVPAPASAAFGGIGVAGIMLLAALRSRRSIGA